MSQFAGVWLEFHRRWLLEHPCVYVLLYDDLVKDVTGQIQKVKETIKGKGLKGRKIERLLEHPCVYVLMLCMKT